MFWNFNYFINGLILGLLIYCGLIDQMVGTNANGNLNYLMMLNL